MSSGAIHSNPPPADAAPDPAPAPPAPAPAPPSLAHRTLTGFVALTAQTVSAKLVAMAGQVVLAWLLKPEAFGLVGLAYTVTAFASLIQYAGLREILIHRQAHFDRWANPAFWMSLSLGCLGALVMFALTPLAVWMYEEPALYGLLLVLALAAPISGLDAVPEARLTSELRFGYLAAVRLLTAVLTVVLSIAFARAGMGAYSFVVPVPIVTALRLALLWVPAWKHLRIRPRPQVRRWKYLVNDSAMLFLANFLALFTWQGDYVILGAMHDPKTVGVYFLAFNLSVQTLQVFTSNLTGVLFPALSRLQADTAYQTRAFLNAASMLALIGVPLCLLQAALAGPVMTVAFNSWWFPAIRVLQLLSLGMAVRLVASPAGSLIQAQGRFGTHLVTNAVNVALFLALVWTGARVGLNPPASLHWVATELHAAVFVAGAVAVYFVLIGPAFIYIAIRPGGGKMADVWRVYAGPFAAGVLAVVPAVLLGRLVPEMPEHDYRVRQVLRAVVVATWTLVAYVPLARLLAPQASSELMQRLGALRRRRRAGGADVTTGTAAPAA